MMKKFVFLCICVFSSQTFGQESFACFETGEEDPTPKKLVISESDGWWWHGAMNWQINSEDDFCSASANFFESDTGWNLDFCFDEQGSTLHVITVIFSGVQGSEGKPFVYPQIHRCVEL